MEPAQPAKSNLVLLQNFKMPPSLKDLFEYMGSSGKTTILKCLTCSAELRGQGKQIFNFQRHLKDKHQITVSKPAVQSTTLLDHLTVAPRKPISTTTAPQKWFRQAVLDLIALDGHPINIVEGVGFQNFVQKLNPSVTCHSSRTVKKDLEDVFKKTVVPNLNKDLADQPQNSVHLTLDMWTSRRQYSIMGVNASYISLNWKLHRRCLAFSPFPENHTGVNIEAKLRSILAERKLQPCQIGKVMADNASNIVAAFNLSSVLTGDWNLQHTLEDYDENSDEEFVEDDDTQEDEAIQIIHHWERLGCCAHSLQLCVKSALKDDSAAKHVLDLVNKITLHFRRSNKLSTLLKSKTKNQRGLILPGKTRWNSILHSLKRLLKEDVYSAVAEILKSHPLPSKSNSSGYSSLTNGIRPQMEELLQLLDPINTATNRLQGNGITSSLVIPSILEAYVDIGDTTTTFFPTLQRSLLEQLQRRFSSVVKEDAYVAASVLDPRQKLRVFKTLLHSRGLAVPTEEEARFTFQKLFETTASELPCSAVEEQPEVAVTDEPKKKRRKAVFEFLDTVSPSVSVAKSELDVYLDENTTKSEEDPLVFWKDNQCRFPRLASLAKNYLSIPASSGDVERLFSIAGSLQRARRSSLQPNTLEQLLLYREFRHPFLV